MHLIDKQDDISVLLHFIHQALDAALKLTAEPVSYTHLDVYKRQVP